MSIYLLQSLIETLFLFLKHFFSLSSVIHRHIHTVKKYILCMCAKGKIPPFSCCFCCWLEYYFNVFSCFVFFLLLFRFDKAFYGKCMYIHAEESNQHQHSQSKKKKEKKKCTAVTYQKLVFCLDFIF